MLRIEKGDDSNYIELTGSFNEEILPENLEPVCENEEGVILPSSMELDHQQQKYKIIVDVSLEPREVRHLRLYFNHYTIPKEIGFNEDERKLAVCVPDSAIYIDD